MFSPRGVQEAPKRLQVEPKRRPRGSKLSPRGLQELQVEPKKASKKARRATKGQSNNTSTAQKAKTLIFNDPTTLFEGLERSGRAAEGQVRAHFAYAENKLELRRPRWSPNRLGKCSQCRLYRSKWRPRGQGWLHGRLCRAQRGAQEGRVDSTDGRTGHILASLDKS